jgi:hypothetical protein
MREHAKFLVLAAGVVAVIGAIPVVWANGWMRAGLTIECLAVLLLIVGAVLYILGRNDGTSGRPLPPPSPPGPPGPRARSIGIDSVRSRGKIVRPTIRHMETGIKETDSDHDIEDPDIR